MGAIHLHRDGAVARLVIDNQPRNMATTVMFEQLGQHVRDIPLTSTWAAARFWRSARHGAARRVLAGAQAAG